MGRTKNGRSNGSGYLEKRGDIWLARWVFNGERHTRSTGFKVSGGKKAKAEAEKMLKEFTAPFQAKDEKIVVERQLARLNGLNKEIAEEEAKNPALKFMQGWSVYFESQSRPRSGKGTLHNYELQYFQFVEWMKQYHPEVEELRGVSREVAEEYSAFLLAGTPKEEQKRIDAARTWVYHFNNRRKDDPRPLSQDEEKVLAERRALAARFIREPVRGSTYNKHLNALALMWRHIARNKKARITVNPWAFDENNGIGIRRIKLTHAERPHSRRALTVEEVYKILKAAKGEMRVLIAIGFYTGLRLGDAVLLDWGQIDRVTGIITVRSRKTDTETRAAVHPALARIIEEETHGHTGYVIPTLAQRYLSNKSERVKICNEISALFESVGIVTKFVDDTSKRARSECGFHSLRHTFVTALRARGAGLQTTQALAGHNTARMTEHYTHEDGKAVLMLPDVTIAQEDNGNVEMVENSVQTIQEAPCTRMISLAELKAALAQMTPDQRRALLA